jgi:hypothetical protein
MPNGFAKLGRKFYFGPYESAVIPNAAFLVGPSCRFRWSRVAGMLTCAVLLVKHSGELLDCLSLPPRREWVASCADRKIGYRFVALDRVQRPLALELS